MYENALEKKRDRERERARGEDKNFVARVANDQTSCAHIRNFLEKKCQKLGEIKMKTLPC